jgi:hypothetical protein
MKKIFNEEVVHLREMQKQHFLPKPVAPEKDTDDYEDFDDDTEMMESLWHQGEEAFEDEVMKAEEDY